jgi:hypothetical protein
VPGHPQPGTGPRRLKATTCRCPRSTRTSAPPPAEVNLSGSALARGASRAASPPRWRDVGARVRGDPADDLAPVLGQRNKQLAAGSPVWKAIDQPGRNEPVDHPAGGRGLHSQQAGQRGQVIRSVLYRP